MLSTNNRKKVLCPLERKNGKTFWMNIGTAFSNADGSTNVYLDAYPSNGKLHIRELDERDLAPKGDPQRGRKEQGTSEELPF